MCLFCSFRVIDDVDLGVDYCVEEDDVAFINKKYATYPDPESVKAFLTFESLESIFNLLERNTGFGDVISYSMAERIVYQVVPSWTAQFTTKVLPEIYQVC